MKEIFTIDCEIPGGYGTHESFYSRRSLMDADLILLRTASLSTHYIYGNTYYKGKPSMPESASFRMKQSIEHWRREIRDAIAAGKTVFVLLGRLDEVYVRTGEKTFSGAGRNRVQTTHVEPLSNYDVLQFGGMNVVHSEGEAMILQREESLLKEYWDIYETESQYCVYFEKADGGIPLVTTKNGQRIVSLVYRDSSGGALVALPWLDLTKDEFFNDEDEQLYDEDDDVAWTTDAKKWGLKYFQILSSIDDAIKKTDEAEPIPHWVSNESLLTYSEWELRKELSEIESKIEKLQEKQKETALNLEDAALLRPLLYAQGQSLEEATLRAMRILGFNANHFRNADSEFDAVLECPEGRIIGEVEGKDRRSVDVNKIRQLITNLMEDDDRDEVAEKATGVLFGNAYRLTSPSERPADQFTQKCLQTAEARGIVLIRTCDLFEVTRTLVDTPDEDFATECRNAIFAARGQIVQFPKIPDA